MQHPVPTAVFVTAGLLLGVIGAPTEADARQVRGGTRTSVNGGGRAQSASANRGGNVNRGSNVNRGANVNNNANVNRNVNVNQNVNVHRDIDVDVDHGHYHGHYHHPVAAAVGVTAAVAVTAAVVGSIVYSLPPTCSAVVTAGVTYQQCGSTWYQPRYAGTQVSYVVVNPP
jgi:hypothetical protein